jgi:serine/threonine-protein kinase
VVVAPDGTVFLSEGFRIRRVSPDGTISTYAGDGSSTWSGDGGPALQAGLALPGELALGKDGTLYVSEPNRVRAISVDGTIRTVAGTGVSGSAGDGGPAISATLSVNAIAIGPDQSLYVADSSHRVVRRVDPEGTISTFAGNGEYGFLPIGDGGPATATQVGAPISIAVTQAGEVYFGATHFGGEAIHKVDANGIISTVLGNGKDHLKDGLLAKDTYAIGPDGLALDRDGTLYLTDVTEQVWRIEPDGRLRLIAGTGKARGATEGTGDQGLPTQATFVGISSLSVGPDKSTCADTRQGGSAIAEFDRIMGGGEQRVLAFERFGTPPIVEFTLTCSGYLQLDRAWGRDLYLVEADWTWSFVMSHEAIGPYFLFACGSVDSDGFFQSC